MTAYAEYELRCDAIPGDQFGCLTVVFGFTAKQARADAREDGWRVALPGGRDLCPKHRQAQKETP